MSEILLDRPDRFTRAYIDACGCSPVWLVIADGHPMVSRAAFPWDSYGKPMAGFWYARPHHAKSAAAYIRKAVGASGFRSSVDFAQAAIGHSDSTKTHRISHAQICTMAANTLIEIEAEYAAKKKAGALRAYFKKQKEARMAAKLLGDRVTTVAEDEMAIKISMMKAAIARG